MPRWGKKRQELKDAIIASTMLWAKPISYYEHSNWYAIAEDREIQLVAAIKALEKHIEKYGEA